MQILIVLAHPDPASFTHALAARTATSLRASGHRVILRDLYAESFDPLLPAGESVRGAVLPTPIADACSELTQAEGLIIVHPNWWGMPPAILVGWVDRVVRPGVAYEFREGDGGEGVPVGLLRARTAVVLNTANTPDEREQRTFGDPLDRIWRACIFDLCGVQDVRRRTFSVMVTSTDGQRTAWLAEAEALVSDAFPAARGADTIL